MERFQDSKKNVPLELVAIARCLTDFRYWKRPEGPRESGEKRPFLPCTALQMAFEGQLA